MSSQSLLELIRAYEGAENLRVEIHLKNGQVGLLGPCRVDQESIRMEDGRRFPFSMVSHAEITSRA